MMQTNHEQKEKREPLFHVSKRDTFPVEKSILIRVGAILVALVITGILSVVLIKENPFKIYAAMFSGPFLDTWSLLQDTAVLLIFGLAVIPAFKMKFWNMGANGQVLIGCLTAIACMKFLTGKLPSSLIMLVMILTSLITAIVWAVVPAVFKAFFNTNETLFTLMMNYIAIGLVDYFVFAWDKSGSGTIGIINLRNKSHPGWFPELGNEYVLTILVALILTAIIYVYIRYTKHGFEVELVGESVSTARYAGINVKKVVIRTLILSGAICGIMGALYAGSIEHTVNTAVGGKGFTAILVAWLAGFNPLVMLLTSFFVVFLTSGAEYINTAFQLGSNDYASIIVGIVFFCVIGCEFFIRYDLDLSPMWKEKFSVFKEKIKAKFSKSSEKEDV